MTLLTPVHSKNDPRVYFLNVLTTDYCWCSWTCLIAVHWIGLDNMCLIVVPDKFNVDLLVD